MEKIRRIQLKDKIEIKKILDDFSCCLPSLEKGEEQREMMAQKFSNFSEFLVIYIQEEIAGFVAFYANNCVEKIAYISMIAVKKNFRQQGVGALLLKECESVARKNGMKKIKLEVLKENSTAISFYQKKGFLFSEKREDALYMIKIL